MHHAFKFEEQSFNVELSRAASGYRLHIRESILPVNLHFEDDGSAVLTVDGVSERVLIAVHGNEVFVHLDGSVYALRYQHPLERLAAATQGPAEDSVRAPMPGSLVAVYAAVNQMVKKGDPLLVMESMKMETTITAPRDGTIEAIHFELGQAFDRDALLLRLVTEGKP